MGLKLTCSWFKKKEERHLTIMATSYFVKYFNFNLHIHTHEKTNLQMYRVS